MVTVPDELVDKIRHVSMAADLDKGAKTLRDESLQRLVSFFGCRLRSCLVWVSPALEYWLVKQDTIDSHIVPGLQLICDALTTEFLLASGDGDVGVSSRADQAHGCLV